MTMNPIRQARSDRGLTLRKVADAVGTDPGNLSRIERGEQSPGLELARGLSEFYGLPVEQILYPVESPQGTAA